MPIVPADAVGPELPALPADPPIDFHLEDEDGAPAGFAPQPVIPPVPLVDPPANYLPPSPSHRYGHSRHGGGEEGDGSDFLAGSSQLPGRRLLPHVDALAPILAAHQLPQAAALTEDLVRETAGRGLSSAFAEEDFRTAALALVRYRLSALAIIRQTDRGARRMFLPDLREMGRKAFPEMQLLMQLLAHFAPVQKQRANPKGPTFEEVFPPAKMKDYKADFSCLGGFMKPNQDMANYIRKELILGKLHLRFPPGQLARSRGDID